jgi:hypothetical protein
LFVEDGWVVGWGFPEESGSFDGGGFLLGAEGDAVGVVAGDEGAGLVEGAGFEVGGAGGIELGGDGVAAELEVDGAVAGGDGLGSWCGGGWLAWVNFDDG